MAQEKSNSQAVQAESNSTLSADKILMAEFKYAQETAAQAMEDRHRMVNFYLLIVGVVMNVIAALLKRNEYPEENLISVNEIKGMIIFLFLALFIVGVLYLYKLIRLRWMWYGSAEVMNKIKDYYDKNFGDYRLKEKAFIWTTETLKAMKPESFATIYFGSAVLIIGINSMSLGGAIYFLLRRLLPAFFTFTFFVFLEILYYRIMLKRKKTL